LLIAIFYVVVIVLSFAQENITKTVVSYCRAILVGKQNEKEMKTTLYTIYKDAFVKANGKWLIKQRLSR